MQPPLKKYKWSAVNSVGMVWDIISYAKMQLAKTAGGCTTSFMVLSVMCTICEGPKLDP